VIVHVCLSLVLLREVVVGQVKVPKPRMVVFVLVRSAQMLEYSALVVEIVRDVKVGVVVNHGLVFVALGPR
jgi:hypothetical protein